MKYCLFLSIFLISAVMADSSFWEVENVEIKQEGQNSVVAKQRALSKSASSAFLKLFTSEELKKFAGYANKFSDKQIQDCVYDYSIEEEKSSDSFYIGEFSYRFSKNRVVALLKKFGANISAQKSSKVVKIAIYKKDYLDHSNLISKSGSKVLSFSSEKVILEINDINKFKKFNITYVRL
ncbi:MAG: hypothetical protein K6C34_04395 [Alphaproteobacteria bacterium]|nr:hypothetical protein [Alphaproteobacteria bacterium]